MSPQPEAARPAAVREERSAEFIAFDRLVGVLLSVSRAELQKKLQGEAENNPEEA